MSRTGAHVSLVSIKLSTLCDSCAVSRALCTLSLTYFITYLAPCVCGRRWTKGGRDNDSTPILMLVAVCVWRGGLDIRDGTGVVFVCCLS